MALERERSDRDISTVLAKAKEAIELYERELSNTTLEPIEKLAAVILAERKKQKITRDLLAKLSGVSVGTINAIEAGKTTASLSNVQRILTALGKNLWIK